MAKPNCDKTKLTSSIKNPRPFFITKSTAGTLDKALLNLIYKTCIPKRNKSGFVRRALCGHL